MIKLTDEQTKMIEDYRSQMKAVQEKINQLEEEKERIHYSFEEYAGYCDHYRAYYEDEPLSIAEYFKALNRWNELMAEHNEIYATINPHDLNADHRVADEFEKRTAAEFAHLERVLGA